MKNILQLNFWSGYKTYAVAFLLVAYAIGGYFTGNLELSKALELLGLGSLGATLRKGMKSE